MKTATASLCGFLLLTAAIPPAGSSDSTLPGSVNTNSGGTSSS